MLPRSVMAAVKATLLVLILAYGGLVAVMYVTQRSLMYFPDPTRMSPAAAGLAAAEELTLATADGEHVIAWHVPPRGAEPIIIYFHGNGGALHYRVRRFATLAAEGFGLLALSYRGYGGSSGSPSEAGLLRDAAAAYEFARARYDPSRLVLWGESLGSGVAVALATERRSGGLILEAPFTSAAAVAAKVYYYLPVRLLMKDQFRSDERIARVTAPTLVLHGERDEVVPFAMGERLYSLIRAPKRFARFPAGGHEDLDAYGALDAVRSFLRQRSSVN